MNRIYIIKKNILRGLYIGFTGDYLRNLRNNNPKIEVVHDVTGRLLFFRPLVTLKGLSHEIFEPVFWPVWMHLGLNVNRLWFLKFTDAHLTLGN